MLLMGTVLGLSIVLLGSLAWHDECVEASIVKLALDSPRQADFASVASQIGATITWMAADRQSARVEFRTVCDEQSYAEMLGRIQRIPGVVSAEPMPLYLPD
jgi:hypothetical protein